MSHDPKLPYFDSNILPTSIKNFSETTFDIQKIHTAFTIAKNFSENARTKLINLNQQKSVTKDFEIGDLVLVSFPRSIHPTNSKIQHQFRGPYIVLAKVTPVTYQVALSLGAQTSTVHVSRMKIYLPPLDFSKQNLNNEELASKADSESTLTASESPD